MGFFKSKASSGGTSTSSNGAYNYLHNLLSPQVSAGSSAIGTLSGALTGDSGAYDTYKNSTGFNNQLDAMSRAVTGNQAARGLLQSGSTGTALQTNANNLAQSNFGNYLAQLLGLGQLGNQSAQILAGAAPTTTTSTNTQSSSPSLGNILGGVLSFMSDRRLKRDIEKVGEMDDGLGVYEYRYVGETGRHIGVMADEVEKLRPWALGPEVNGFKSVNYGAL